MNLLIVTQKVDKNDDILGFFHGWVEKLAEKTTSVFVVANYVGDYNLPSNVKIFSLGKERGLSSPKRYLIFFKIFFSQIKKIDAVFFHMCPEYVLAGGWISKFFGKRNFLWFTHKKVNWKLKIAEKLVDKIFTASKESCRLDSKKIVVTGHGIDINKFQKSSLDPLRSEASKTQDRKFTIITVGRIASVKNIHILVKVAEILKNKNFNSQIKIAGTPVLKKDKKYFEELKKSIREKRLENDFQFAGKISNKDISDFYQSGDLFINLSDTGSIDKAMLEAMASGLLVLTSNEAFKKILEDKYFTSKKPLDISRKIMLLSKDRYDISLRDYVVQNHNLDRLIERLTRLFL